MIQGRIRFGNGDIGTPPNIEQIHSGATDDFIKFGASVGKTLVGIHRASGCLFVICQEDDASNGMDVETLRDRLQTMGVDDVVICDSSDSATLLVDGTIHATPAIHKNNSIPTGLMFRLMPLGFGSGATFRVDGGTDTQFLDRFPVETELRDMRGTITPRVSGGLELIIDSFGAVPPFAPHEVAAEMGIALLPVTLIATGTDF